MKCAFLYALVSCLGFSALTGSTAALAEGAYPDRPITIVVPQAVGGANDAIARIVGNKMSVLLGQTVIIENRTGAGGNIGTSSVTKAKADGYTLLFTANSAHVINPWLYKSTGFDPVKDFAPVAVVATAGYVMVANPAFPPNSLKELVTYVKSAPPGSISYASSGNGTLNHLTMEMVRTAAKMNLVHVPYRGAGGAVTDVVGGQLPLSVQSVPSALGFIKAGKLKVLAVINEKRLPFLPGVASINETFPGLGSTPWYGMLAPTGTPPNVVDKLQATLAKVLESKDVQDLLAAQGCEASFSPPAEFAKLIRADLVQWARVVKETAVTLD